MIIALLLLACGAPTTVPEAPASAGSVPAAPTPAAPAEGTPAADASTTAPAQAAALAWLALVDSGAYGDSYDQAAAVFRGALTRDAWIAAVSQVRTPLGAVSSRELIAATPMTTLPGAPPGEYVVIQYTTAFAGRPGSVETITPMKDPDGAWRVSGYYVK